MAHVEGARNRSLLLRVALLGVAVLVLAGIAYALTHRGGPGANLNPSGGNGLATPGGGQTAPEFNGIVDWENTDGKALTMASLRGRVVLIDFWTYSCINCQRTFPYLRAWHQRYKDMGLVIVGVHSPEFDFEKNVDNVRAAIKRYDVQWPVAVDSNMDTWNAYSNQYWPAEYLVDKKGQVRHTHFGEGEYEQTEQNIQALLKEAGKPVPSGVAVKGMDPGISADSRLQTHELYTASGRGFSVNDEHKDQDFDYQDPGPDAAGHRRSNAIYWQGRWNIGGENATHARDSGRGDDFVLIDYLARRVFIVAATAGGSQRVYVTLDGKDVATPDAGKDLKFDADGHSYVDVDHSDLFALVARPDFTEHVLKLSPVTRGLQLFTYTFGS